MASQSLVEVKLMAAMIDAYILRCDYDGPYRGYIWRVENTIKAFQSYIDCTLLRVVSLTPEIVMIVQDAAKLRQFPFNPDSLNRAWMAGEKIHDFFRGNILCVRRSRNGNEFASIKHEDIAEIEHRLFPLKTISEGKGYSDFVVISADHCPEWRPFYAIDFSALSPEEKVKLMSRPQDDMEASFEDEPLEFQRLAMALIFTRWWNSYKHMAPGEPAPEIIGTAIELLWDFLEGKCGDREFDRFQRSFYNSAEKVVFRDDRGLKRDEESEAFYQAHFSQWKSKSYNNFCVWFASILKDIVNKGGYNLSWLPVEYILFNDIEDMVDFFEEVYQDDQDDSGGDLLAGFLRRKREIYNTPTFCRVIALLQQDMRTALLDASLSELRAKYREEHLFSPEESAKISHFGRG
jgi:hypothetical protein